MPLVREAAVTTVAADGRVDIAPLGLTATEEDRWILVPDAGSTAQDNLRAVPQAVANYVMDVRIIAGCLTGRQAWPLLACSHVLPPRLAAALTHEEMVVERVLPGADRPRFLCRVVHRETHAAFDGFNRAQAAVIEAASLLGRLPLLPRATVERELVTLRHAVAATAGAAEHTAWDWLEQAIAAHYAAA